MFTNDLLISNTSPDQSRNLKPTVSTQNAYSASPSQLTLPSDIPSAPGLPHPYQQYSYLPGHHDPSAFAFPPQPGYRPQLQAQHPHAGHHYQQPSPTNSRKRRASELDHSLPGSASSNASAFGNPTGLVAGATDLGLDVSGGGMGGPAQQTLPSPVAKKGRTNTPWTPAEEQRLKTLREAGSSWSEIAKTFPTRTEGSVKKHWYKVRMPHPPNRVHRAVLVADAFHRTCITRSSQKTRLAISFASPRDRVKGDMD